MTLASSSCVHSSFRYPGGAADAGQLAAHGGAGFSRPGLSLADTFQQHDNDWRDAVVEKDAATLDRAHAPHSVLFTAQFLEPFKC